MKGRTPLQSEAWPASGPNCPTVSPCLVALVALPVAASGPASLAFPLSLAASALLGISLFGRRKRKPKQEEEPEKAEETPALPAPTQAPTPGGDASLIDLLSRARYPISGRSRLVVVLGGEGAQVRLPDSSSWLPAGEVADRCLSKAKAFSSPSRVLEALSSASWATTVIYYVNTTPFPIQSQDDLPKTLLAGYVEGIRISKLAGVLQYPIPNVSELLSQLSKVRFEAPIPEDGAAKGDLGKNEAGKKEGQQEKAEGSSEPQVGTPDSSSNPKEAQEAVA